MPDAASSAPRNGGVKPIAHLYKSQVYQLAAYLDLPQEIRSPPDHRYVLDAPIPGGAPQLI